MKKSIIFVALMALILSLNITTKTAYATEETTSEEATTEEATTEEVLTGWQTIDGSTYYYNSDGTVATGFMNIDGSKYYFNSNGVMVTGFKKIGSSKYYFKKSGVMVTGLKKIDGYKYYFKSSGVMVTGWKKISGYKYYFNASGKAVTGWKKINGKKYYFKKSGKMATGLTKIGSKKYYFNKKGVLQKKKIVGTKKTGYYYAGSDGVVCTDKATRAACKWLMANTTSSMTRAQKLKAAYNYLWKNMTYKRTYGIPGASDLTDYAVEMLTTKQGNCFKYAASFAVFAKVLGYQTRVSVGYTTHYNGGWTSHGWTEVKVNGTWYLCDPDMQMNHPSVNAYMRTESTYPYKHKVSNKYTLTISNGKLKWTKN